MWTQLDSSPRGIENIQRGKHLTGQAVITLSFFVADNYWSSTENNVNNAWRQNFSNGDQNNNNKNNSNYVRCVRSLLGNKKSAGALASAPCALFYHLPFPFSLCHSRRPLLARGWVSGIQEGAAGTRIQAKHYQR